MFISVVIPVFNSAASLAELYDRLQVVLTEGSYEWEIIMVDDASRDDSFQVMQSIRAQDTRVKLIRLEKNAGQHNATLCGLQYSEGDVVVTIDDDLQNPPEEIPVLIRKIENGHDVVFGIPQEKQQQMYRNWGSWLIDKSIQAIFPVAREIKRSSFRILTRELVDRILTAPSTPIYMAALILTNAYSPGNVEVDHAGRKYGRSNYNVLKTLAMARNLLINYSYLPIKMMAASWLILLLVSMVWLRISGALSGPGRTYGALIILLAGTVLTLASIWLAAEYGIIFKRHKDGPQLPYMIKDLEL